MPVPRAASFTALNEQLLEGCRRRLAERLRGHDETIGERVARDLAAFQDLPPAPYDACEKKAARVSSQSLVRYRGTDYSVPTAYGASTGISSMPRASSSSWPASWRDPETWRRPDRGGLGK